MIRLVLLAALLVACSKKKAEDAAPSCDQVVDHMLEVTKQMLPGHGDQPMGDRKAMIAQCEQRNMPAAQRRCLVAAKSFDDLAKCRGNETPPAQRPVPVAPPPTPSPPTPAPAGEPGSAEPAGSGG
jgi:hypothetical protein